MEGNLELLNDTKSKFIIHRKLINEKIKEFIEHDIYIRQLNKEEEENLNNLRTIEVYLNKTIDEEQKILMKHFDLKSVYGNELENISKMSLIERFNFRTEVFEKVLNNPKKLENIDFFFMPLFKMNPNKIYNINKAIEYQKNIKKSEAEEDEELSFEESDLLKAENIKLLERLEKYKAVIEIILELAVQRESISLSEIKELIGKSNILMEKLIPTVEIFREVIIEMLKNKSIDIYEIREERKNSIENGEIEFQLNKSILEVIDNNMNFKCIEKINVKKLLLNEDVKLEGLRDENGSLKNFICSDIGFEVIKEGVKL